MTAVTEDPMVVYVREVHERHDRDRESVRARALALGYVFGRTAERIDGGDYRANSDHASAFADFYEKHTDGNWADLTDQYAAFQSRKDTPK
jgi:hypothetical protein